MATINNISDESAIVGEPYNVMSVDVGGLFDVTSHPERSKEDFNGQWGGHKVGAIEISVTSRYEPGMRRSPLAQAISRVADLIRSRWYCRVLGSWWSRPVT